MSLIVGDEDGDDNDDDNDGDYVRDGEDQYEMKELGDVNGTGMNGTGNRGAMRGSAAGGGVRLSVESLDGLNLNGREIMGSVGSPVGVYDGSKGDKGVNGMLAPSQRSNDMVRIQEENEDLRKEYDSILASHEQLQREYENSAAEKAELRKQLNRALITNAAEIPRLREYEVELGEREMRIEDLRSQAAEVPRLKAEIRSLKDHLDVQTAASATADATARMVEQYKKKLEKASSYRKEVKDLEQQNDDCRRRIRELETKLERTDELQTELEHYRSEVARLDARAKGAMSDAACYRAEAARAKEEKDAALIDARNSQSEVASLREKLLELQMQIMTMSDTAEERDNGVAMQMVGRQMQERLLQLEKENLELKQSLAEPPSLVALQRKVEDLERQGELFGVELDCSNERASESEFCRDVKEISMLSAGMNIVSGRREGPPLLLTEVSSGVFGQDEEDGSEARMNASGIWGGSEFTLSNAEEHQSMGEESGDVGVREIVVVDDGWEKDWASLEETTSDLKRVQDELGSYKAELEEIKEDTEWYNQEASQNVYFANGLKVETSIIDAELEQTKVRLEQERGDKLKIQESLLRSEIQAEQFKMQVKQARLEALGLRQQLVIVKAETEEYKSQLEMLQSELEAVRRESEQMVEELCRKEGEGDEVMEKVEAKHKEIEELQAEVREMEEERNDLRETIQKMQTEVDNVRKVVEEKTEREKWLMEELDRVRNDAAERLSEVNDLLREKEKWGERVLTAELAKAGVETKLTEARAAAEAARVEVERLKKDLVTSMDKVKRKEDKLAGHLASGVMAKEDKNREAKLAEERVKEAEARQKEAEKMLEDMLEEAEERKGSGQSLESKIRDLERQVKELEREKEGYRILVAQHLSTDETLRGELMETKKEMAAAIAAANTAHEQSLSSSLTQVARALTMPSPRGLPMHSHVGIGGGMGQTVPYLGKDMESSLSERERMLIERARQVEEKYVRQEMALRRHEQVIKDQERKLRQMREEEEDRRGQTNSMEVAVLRTQVEELKHQIRTADKARAENKEMAMKEQRMITASFYDINLELQRVKHKIAVPSGMGGSGGGASSMGIPPSRASLVNAAGLGGFPGGPGMMMTGAMSASTSFTSSPSQLMLGSANGQGMVQGLTRPMSAKVTLGQGRLLYGNAMDSDMGGERGHDRVGGRHGGHLSAPVSPMSK